MAVTVKLKSSAKRKGRGTNGRGTVVRVLECPECGSHDVFYQQEPIFCRSICKRCGYKGGFVTEYKVVVKDDEKVEKV